MHSSIDQYFSDNLFHHLQDGIIVMNDQREIIKINHAAEKLMGWRENDAVPYCAYCEKRSLHDGEERCYLIAKGGKVPYLTSQLPRVGEYMVNVEMSNVLIYEDKRSKQKYYLLVIRDRSLKEQENAAKLSKRILHRLTEAQEVEHQRLSQELHDGVGQSLYSVALGMDHLSKFIVDDNAKQYFKEVRAELGKAIEDVKFYSQTLRPKSLDALGLVPTIDSLLQSAQDKFPQLRIEFTSNCHERLSSIAEINIYRIIQEALHNMMKYAQATKAAVDLDRDRLGLKIEITDNGVGFDVDAAKDGLGILHMKERVAQLEGKITIESQQNKGTTISIYIPNKTLEGDLHEPVNRG